MTELDTSLLAGLTFRCRPDCGLCCYATPAVTNAERPALVQLVPTLRLLEDDRGGLFVADRPDGGACQLLRQARCAGHAARPFPCRAYPVTVHLGARAQATPVWGCPGLFVDGLLASHFSESPPAPVGLEAELEAVRAEMERPETADRIRRARDRWERARRSLERSGRWAEPETLRRQVENDRFSLDLAGYPADPPPAGPAEELPFTFDAGHGVVAFSGDRDEWTIHSLPEEGGGEPIGRYRVDPEPPTLTAAAADLLRQYLRHILRRDLFWGQILYGLARDPRLDLSEGMTAEVRWITAQVVTRGRLLAIARGEPAERLEVSAIDAGIRATDSEVIDRPSAGEIL